MDLENHQQGALKIFTYMPRHQLTFPFFLAPEIKPKKAKKAKKSKKNCPDFFEKGICTQGDTCEYAHSGAIVTIDNDRADDKLKVPLGQLQAPLPNIGSTYDPAIPALSGLPPVPVPPPAGDANSSLAATLQQNIAALANVAAQQTIDSNPNLLRSLAAGVSGANFNNPALKSLAALNISGRPGEVDPLKIHVSRIPENLNNITKLNDHFCKFGEITNIQVSVEKSSASIEFQSKSDCEDALLDEAPVLNNRHIVIKPFRNPIIPGYLPMRGGYRGRGRGRGGMMGRGAHGPNATSGGTLAKVSVHHRLGHNNPNVSRKDENNTPHIPDPAEFKPAEPTEKEKLLFAKTQERINAAKEVIKQREDNQLENAKRAKINLLNQQRALLEKQIVQQKRLVEKLQDPTTRTEEKPSLLQTLKSLASNTDEMRSRVKILESEIYEDEKRNRVEKELDDTEKLIAEKSQNSQDTQELRLKLYKLQDEAQKLGIYKKRQQKAMQDRLAARGGIKSVRGIARGQPRTIATLNTYMAQKANQFQSQGAIEQDPEN